MANRPDTSSMLPGCYVGSADKPVNPLNEVPVMFPPYNQASIQSNQSHSSVSISKPAKKKHKPLCTRQNKAFACVVFVVLLIGTTLAVIGYYTNIGQ